jgi:hypothetical protein
VAGDGVVYLLLGADKRSLDLVHLSDDGQVLARHRLL